MIRIDGEWFKDDQGRTLFLRGANVSGSSKVPFTPDGATYRREGFFDHRTVSFVGRPFPLAEADEHFRRLRAWGMTFLRFLITWEAVEHAGPGQYDTDYLDYLYAVIEKAHEHGIRVFIDPHQDVWSRWTGGDGAPGWTLEAVGIDLTKLHETGAAINHALHGDPFPRMIWPTNYSKLGAATMFTLFFAGNDFAPQTVIDGQPVGDYLQGHYIRAIQQVARRLKDLPNVVGYDSLNEPGSGYIGVQDLAAPFPGLLAMGAMPTAFQGMLAGAGYPQEVTLYEFGMMGPQPAGTTVLNPKGVSLWRDECIWKRNGVWTDSDGTPKLLRADYFARTDLGESNFIRDYLKPFIRRFITAIREIVPDAILFLEGVPGGSHPDWSSQDAPNAVNAAHWYDALTLFTKMFNRELTVNLATGEFVQGTDAVAAAIVEQLAHVRRESAAKMGGIPTLIGEFGLPFDLNDKAGYASGDFSVHTQALDLYYDAMDANLLNCTIWNYTPDNSNARGDLWNDEDLSIFSRDQQDAADDIHAGGRGLPGFVRPYARAVAGTPLRMSFELDTRTFQLEYRPDTSITAPSEIFIPTYQYRNGIQVELSDGTWDYNRDQQLLTVEHGMTPGQQVMLRVTPA